MSVATASQKKTATANSGNPVFASVRELLASIEQEKSAADDANSSHETASVDSGKVPVTTGEHAADDKKILTESIPNIVDAKPEANTTTVDIGVVGDLTGAKPTGDDPADVQGTKHVEETGPKTGQGGTEHPANMNYGEKYASLDDIAKLPDDELFKLAVDLTNSIAADLIQGKFAGYVDDGIQRPSELQKAAETGYNAAASAAQPEIDQDEAAAQMLAAVIKQAHLRADLVSQVLSGEATLLQKAADEEAANETEETSEQPTKDTGVSNATASVPVTDGSNAGGEAVLNAMAGGPGGEAAVDPAAVDPAALAAAGAGDGGAGGGQPSEEEVMQELVMALLEAGVTPEELMALGGDVAPKMAKAAKSYQQSGRFRFAEAKTARQRTLRDDMKRVINELRTKSQS